jgi:NADH-quinone oxidoreductase subunit K
MIDSSINLIHLLLVSGILFCIGVYGVLINRSSYISVFISLQIIFISIILTLISFAVSESEVTVQLFAMFISIVMMVEFIVGIAILFIFYRGKQK